MLAGHFLHVREHIVTDTTHTTNIHHSARNSTTLEAYPAHNTHQVILAPWLLSLHTPHHKVQALSQDPHNLTLPRPYTVNHTYGCVHEGGLVEACCMHSGQHTYPDNNGSAMPHHARLGATASL